MTISPRISGFTVFAVALILLLTLGAAISYAQDDDSTLPYNHDELMDEHNGMMGSFEDMEHFGSGMDMMDSFEDMEHFGSGMSMMDSFEDMEHFGSDMDMMDMNSMIEMMTSSNDQA